MIEDKLSGDEIEAIMLVSNFQKIGSIDNYIIYARGYERISVLEREKDNYSFLKHYRSKMFYYDNRIEDTRTTAHYDIWALK